jgi:hypothetical protein
MMGISPSTNMINMIITVINNFITTIIIIISLLLLYSSARVPTLALRGRRVAAADS